MLPEYKTKIDCYLCKPVLAETLFGDLADDALESLTRIKRKRQFEKDNFIFAQGKPPLGIYTLTAGQAQMRFGAFRKPRLIEPNEILGLTGMMADLPCKMSVVTVTPCVFDYIERGDFINFIKDKPEAGFKLAQLMSWNLHKIYELVCSSTT
jgi:CRP-like cAMP-binding protein